MTLIFFDYNWFVIGGGKQEEENKEEEEEWEGKKKKNKNSFTSMQYNVYTFDILNKHFYTIYIFLKTVRSNKEWLYRWKNFF